jgi:hypothetical protein
MVWMAAADQEIVTLRNRLYSASDTSNEGANTIREKNSFVLFANGKVKNLVDSAMQTVDETPPTINTNEMMGSSHSPQSVVHDIQVMESDLNALIEKLKDSSTVHKSPPLKMSESSSKPVWLEAYKPTIVPVASSPHTTTHPSPIAHLQLSRQDEQRRAIQQCIDEEVYKTKQMMDSVAMSTGLLHHNSPLPKTPSPTSALRRQHSAATIMQKVWRGKVARRVFEARLNRWAEKDLASLLQDVPVAPLEDQLKLSTTSTTVGKSGGSTLSVEDIFRRWAPLLSDHGVLSTQGIPAAPLRQRPGASGS